MRYIPTLFFARAYFYGRQVSARPREFLFCSHPGAGAARPRPRLFPAADEPPFAPCAPQTPPRRNLFGTAFPHPPCPGHWPRARGPPSPSPPILFPPHQKKDTCTQPAPPSLVIRTPCGCRSPRVNLSQLAPPALSLFVPVSYHVIFGRALFRTAALVVMTQGKTHLPPFPLWYPLSLEPCCSTMLNSILNWAAVCVGWPRARPARARPTPAPALKYRCRFY